MALTYKQEFTYSIKLVGSLIIFLLAQSALWLINSLMFGYLGSDALAAGVLISTSYYLIYFTFFGFINAIGICIGQANGQQNSSLIRDYLQQGGYFVSFLSLPMMALLWYLPSLLQLLHQPPNSITLAAEFLHGICWSAIAALGFTLLKEFFSNLEKPIISMLVAILGIPLHALLAYVFTHGVYGLPAGGMFGLGLANTLTQWTMFLTLLTYALLKKNIKPYVRQRLKSINWHIQSHLLYLGTPISITYFFEAALFNVTAMMVGWLSINALAAHQIVLQCTEVIFICFVAISQAGSIRIANCIGQQEQTEIPRIATIVVSLGLLLTIPVAWLFQYYPAQITQLFIGPENTHSQPVYILTQQFFNIATLFIFFDGLQVLGNNLLRGMKDTYIPMALSLTTYWVIGLSTCWLLSFYFAWQGRGIWWGLTAGVATSAITTWLRFAARCRQICNQGL